MNLRPTQLAEFYGSDIIANEIVKSGFLAPWTSGKRLTLYDTMEAQAAGIRYREHVRRHGRGPIKKP